MSVISPLVIFWRFIKLILKTQFGCPAAPKIFGNLDKDWSIKILNEKDASMANADQVKEMTGFTIGGVSPVGHLNPIKIIIDQSLSRFENIFGAAGHPNCVFKINFTNLQKITNGEVKDITEWIILSL